MITRFKLRDWNQPRQNDTANLNTLKDAWIHEVVCINQTCQGALLKAENPKDEHILKKTDEAKRGEETTRSVKILMTEGTCDMRNV